MLHHFYDPFPTVDISSRSTHPNPNESIYLHARRCASQPRRGIVAGTASQLQRECRQWQLKLWLALIVSGIVLSLIAVGDFSGDTKVYVLITALGIAAVTALNLWTNRKRLADDLKLGRVESVQGQIKLSSRSTRSYISYTVRSMIRGSRSRK